MCNRDSIPFGAKTRLERIKILLGGFIHIFGKIELIAMWFSKKW